MELLSMDTAGCVATAFPCLQQLRLVEGNQGSLDKALEGLALLVAGNAGGGQGVSSTGGSGSSSSGVERPASTEQAAARAGAGGDAARGPGMDEEVPTLYEAYEATLGVRFSHYPGALASGLLGSGILGPEPRLGPPVLTGLGHLFLEAIAHLSPSHFVAVIELLAQLPSLARLDLGRGLDAHVHVSSLRPLSRLQALSMPTLALSVGGDPDGLTALSGLMELRMASVGVRRPPLDDDWDIWGVEAAEAEGQRPACALPPRLEVLALGLAPAIYPSLGMDLSTLFGGISQLQTLTKLVAGDLALVGDAACQLPARLPELTLTFKHQPTVEPCRKLWSRGIRATQNLTRLEVLVGGAFNCYLRPESLLGLVGLKELVAPDVRLIATGSLESLTALTLMRLDRLTQAGPDDIPPNAQGGVAAQPGPIPAADLELPPNLQLLQLVARRPLDPSIRFPELDLFSAQGSGRLGCANGPARLELRGPFTASPMWVRGVRGLTALKELVVDAPTIRLGKHGLRSLTALTSLELQCASIAAAPAPAGGAPAADAPPPSLLPRRLQRLVLGREHTPWEVWDAVGRLPSTLQDVPVVPRAFALTEGSHVSETGELLPAAQAMVCRVARLLASLPEPPQALHVGLEVRWEDSTTQPEEQQERRDPGQPSRWLLLPVGFGAAAASSGGVEAPSHAPWLEALGGLPLRQLELTRVRLAEEDLRALVTHMPQLQ
ncbi:hypothetical protein HYH03_016410, partial [Edaphochlamys debaryana]